jgi:hypothetical protein
MEIIGYFVQVVDDEVTAKDILYQQRILYPTWEAALDAASKLVSKHAHNDQISPICTLRSTSKSTCHSMGYVMAYRLESKEVLMFPVLAA